MSDVAYQLMNAFRKAEYRNALWMSDKKNYALRVLHALAKESDDLELSVEKNSDDESEFVRIALPNAQAVNSKKDSRRGGSLIYFLKYNGMVLPVITYPSVDNQVYKLEPKVIANKSIEPEELTKGTIWKHFEEFLKAIYDWETGSSQPVGFKFTPETTSLSDEKIPPPKTPL